MRGRQLDLTVTAPLRQRPQECPRPCALLGRVAGYRESIDLEAGAQARFVILDTSPGQLVIYFRTPAQQFDQVAQQITQLLSGVAVRDPVGSTSRTPSAQIETGGSSSGGRDATLNRQIRRFRLKIRRRPSSSVAHL
jgi:hypothetical protein